MKNWHLLHITRDAAEANILKGMLEENNIEVALMNKIDSSYQVFGEIELYVREEQKDEARELMKSH